MQGERWPAGTTVQRGACACCYAAKCTARTPEQPHYIRAAPAGTPVPHVAASWLIHRKQNQVGKEVRAAPGDALPSFADRLPVHTRDVPNGHEQLRILLGVIRECENETSAVTGACHRTFDSSHLLAFLRLPVVVLVYCKLLLLFFSGSSVTVSLASQLQLCCGSVLPVSPLSARRPELGAPAAAGFPVLSNSPVKPAVHSAAEVLPPTHVNYCLCASPHYGGHPHLRLRESPLGTVVCPAWSRFLPSRRPLAACAGRSAVSSCLTLSASCPSSPAVSNPVRMGFPSSPASATPTAATIACDPSCIAHVSPLSLRTSSHSPCFSYGKSSSAASSHALLLNASPCNRSGCPSTAPTLSISDISEEQQGSEEVRTGANRLQLRCAPAASLSLSSSCRFLRWMRVSPQQVQLEKEVVDIQIPTGNGSLNLVKQQLQQQVQQHQAEIRSLLRGLLQMALQCLRSMWGVYFLGLSVFVLPLCASARPYLEVLNRVPLNDPYFLRHLNLPDDASPALFGLPFYNVKVPPLFLPASFAHESDASLEGRCDANGRSNSSSITPETLQRVAREHVSSQPTPAEAATASGGRQHEGALSPGAEQGASVCGGGRQESFFTNGIAPDFNSSSAGAAGILRGWLVPAERQDSRKGIICTHGWLANRQACLPFLGIAHKEVAAFTARSHQDKHLLVYKRIKERSTQKSCAGLHKDHHIFLFDLRSSGESSSVSARPQSLGWLADQPRPSRNKCSRVASRNSEDQLGCQAAEDLLQAILYLRESCGITTISLYAQGISAMGAMVVLGEYRDQLEQQWGIRIDKVIFDSPICSARDALQVQPLASCLAKTAAWLHEALMWAVSKQRGRQLHRLRASRLLRTGKPYKLLIFSSREDNLAPWPSVRHEILQLPEQDRPDLICVFPTGSHCDLARTHRHLYADVIQKFYKNPSFVQSLWEKLTGIHAPAASPDVDILTPRDFTAEAAAEAAESEQEQQTSQRRLSAAAASLLQSLSCARSQDHSLQEESWT